MQAYEVLETLLKKAQQKYYFSKTPQGAGY